MRVIIIAMIIGKDTGSKAGKKDGRLRRWQATNDSNASEKLF